MYDWELKVELPLLVVRDEEEERKDPGYEVALLVCEVID